MNLGKYSKTIAALVTGIIGWGLEVVNSKPTAVTSSEWIGLAIVVAVALGVYAIPNTAA